MLTDGDDDDDDNDNNDDNNKVAFPRAMQNPEGEVLRSLRLSNRIESG